MSGVCTQKVERSLTVLGASAGLPKLGEDKTDASQPSLQEVRGTGSRGA